MNSSKSMDREQALSRAIANYLEGREPRELAVEHLADWLGVAHPTLDRWSRGVHLPYPATAERMLAAVEKYTDFMQALSTIRRWHPFTAARLIAHATGIGESRVSSWYAGAGIPPVSMLQDIWLKMSDLLVQPEVEY